MVYILTTSVDSALNEHKRDDQLTPQQQRSSTAPSEQGSRKESLEEEVQRLRTREALERETRQQLEQENEDLREEMEEARRERVYLENWIVSCIDLCAERCAEAASKVNAAGQLRNEQAPDVYSEICRAHLDEIKKLGDNSLVLSEKLGELDQMARRRWNEQQEMRVVMSQNTRHMQLVSVFREFDLDETGYVEPAELLQLGKARRSLGQKSGKWTEEKNARLIEKMDKSGDGQICESEFVEHFDLALSQDSSEFDLTIQQFMEVARECAKQKKLARDQAHSPPDTTVLLI